MCQNCIINEEKLNLLSVLLGIVECHRPLESLIERYVRCSLCHNNIQEIRKCDCSIRQKFNEAETIIDGSP